MIPSLYIGRTGLDASQTKLNVISNNLANVSTNGFKRSSAVFEDLIYQNVRQVGAQSSGQSQIPTGLQVGTGTRVVATARIHSQGNLQKTDGPLDLAINGEGFFQVLMPDGTIGYTRDGSFQKDSNGQIVNSNGYPLQPNINVPGDTISLTIGNDGTVSVTQKGTAGATQIGNIQLTTFVNPAGLESIGGNVYIETASSGNATPTTPGTNGSGIISQGYVETSNVNIVEELVSMIQAQRTYEVNSKVISTSDQMLRKLSEL